MVSVSTRDLSLTCARPSCVRAPRLQVFKLKFLLPYLDRLLRLADNKTLREELTAFPLGAR